MAQQAKGDHRLFGEVKAMLEQVLREAAGQGQTSGVQPLILWAVASWIETSCTQPTNQARARHWGASPGHRRRRNGHDWVVFSSSACAEDTLLCAGTTKKAVQELVRLGLVDSYREAEKPRPVPTRPGKESYELAWFGPNTQIVRVVLDPEDIDEARWRFTMMGA